MVMHEACLGALAFVSSVCELVWLLTALCRDLMVLVSVYLVVLAGVFVELGCHDDHSLYKKYIINVVF